MKKSLLIYIIIFLLFLIYHVLTLSISPIVWIDEITLNSITLDYIKNGTYFFLADKSWNIINGKSIYGPIFFSVNSWILSVFGNGIFQGRILELIAGLFLILVITKEYALKKTNWIPVIITVCFLLDPFFSSEMHRGRLDLLALLFYFLALIFLIGNPLKSVQFQKRITLTQSILSGIFYGLSLLTHTRLAFFFPVFFFLFLSEWVQHVKDRKKIFISCAMWGVVLLATYIPWIFIEFGGFKQYVNTYSLIMKQVAIFIGSEYMLLPEVVPIFLIYLFFLVLIFIKYKKYIHSKWLLVCILMPLIFFTLIKDTGHYSILVIPCFYLTIMLAVEGYFEFNKFYKFISGAAVLSLFIVYMLIFFLKTNVLLADYKARSPKTIDQFISDNIPEGVKVCSDEYYYYSLLNNNNQPHLFYSFHAEANPKKIDSIYIEVEKYSREIFNYDYLIISDLTLSLRPELFDIYKKMVVLDSIARYNPPKKQLPGYLAFLSQNNIGKTGYNGTIYKRIRN